MSGMSKICKALFGVTSPYNQAMIEVDPDHSAERIMIIDRRSGKCIQNLSISPGEVCSLRVPLIYNTLNSLIVGIVDDSMVYSSKFVDGVRSELVDGNSVKLG